MSTVCYIPQKGIDDVIASKVLNWTAARVATLRGLYDGEHPDSPIDITNIDDAVNKLVLYRKKLAISNAQKINTFGSNLSSTYETLLETFTAEERFNRVNMIAYLFSVRLDEYQEANPNLSRKMICNGITVDGKTRGGQVLLFEALYNEMLDYWAEAVEEENLQEAKEFQKILENWPALVTYARAKLRDTEELRLGNKLEYADEANPDNFGDNKLSDLYDMEESKKEGWQEISDYQSAFGSISKEVRRFLGSIQKIKDGEEVVDDLGFPIMLDPVKAHQAILEILRGANSESRMMLILRETSLLQEWLNPIIEELENNSILRTQFFVDFKKAFQPYSIMIESFSNGVKTIKTKILNKTQNLLAGKYMTRILLGKPVNTKNSIYDSKGNVNWKNLQNFIRTVDEYLDDTSNKLVKFYTATGDGRISTVEQKKVLKDMLEALGIDIDGESLDKIMSNSKDLRSLTNNIREVVTYGFKKVLDTTTLEAMHNGEYSSIADKKYKNLFKASYAASTAKQGAIKEKVDKILTIVSKHKEALRLESRVRYKNKKGKGTTLFSNVLPSYLSDFMDNIEAYVKAKDTQGLRTFLEEKYLNSSYFKDNGIILNKWLEDLYNSDLSKEDNFAANFSWNRFLGDSDLNFENFTSKRHALAMLSDFFSDKLQNPNSKYAHYPVFILGDSGVSKSIKARRYSSKEVLEGLYNVYRQECRRMSLTKAANEKLKVEGYSTISNFSNKENLFTLLPFLNEAFKGRDISEISESEVKKVIISYLNNSFENFKSRLNDFGILNTVDKTINGVKVTSYEYFSQEAKNEEELNRKLADFYWNTKFATIQLLQLMTIDPAFYKGTKDLQKRYKEIHAPGKVLNIQAVDFNGNLYSEDGIERCVYFDDITLPADADFLEAIKSNFGEDSRYMKYLNNTLTDGLGYRTLDSYRKVKGMAGEWTQEMENAYNEIKSLRNKYGKEDNLNEEDLKRIADLSIVFLPIKPYMYTIENYPINDTDTLKIPVQHKYAEVVLIPELLPKGSKLRDMAYWMEDHVDESGNSAPIDLIGSTTIVKVGSFGSTDISEADNASSLNDALNKAYVHLLSYNDYRLQTNVPEHINSSLLFGTLLRKLIMAFIDPKSYRYEKYVNGNKVNLGGNLGTVSLTGKNLISFYNSLITSNILESYDIFSKEVSDISKLSDVLLQNVINNSRESMDNLLSFSLTGDSNFLMPLFEGSLEHDSSALLFSMFKKIVNKLSIKGGSAVQASAMGLTGYKKDGDLKYVVDPDNPKNVLYAECEIPFDLKYVDLNGLEHALDYNDWCNPDGTLKLGEAIEKTDPRYKNYLSYKDDKGQVHIPLIEEKFPNILSMVANRVPTERAYSIINLKIKRFSNKTAGGTIKVPVQGTTIAGFDFDIDKLYFMRYELKFKPLSKELARKIWKDFYEDNPEIKLVFSKAKHSEENILKLMEWVLEPYVKSDLAKNIKETNNKKDSLSKYWKEAGLKGSPREAINKYILKNITKYNMEFVTYDYTKTPLENSRTARNNMLINLIQNRLMDEETFELRYTPGGFFNASNAARFMRELFFGPLDKIVNDGIVDFDAIEKRCEDKNLDPEPDYDFSDPLTIITYNQQNLVAGKLIGIFANQNSNHAFASLMKSFYLKDKIAFGDHPEGLSDLLHKEDSETVNLNMAEFLAASVDAVKDPVLNFLNLNTITADPGALLARLGYTTREIGLLFNLPIIKEICEYSFNNNTSTENAISEILSLYKVDATGDFSNENSGKELNSENLAYNIVQYRKYKKDNKNIMENHSFRNSQIQVAELFTNILRVSGEVSLFVTTSKFTASNAVGSTFGDSYSLQMKVSKFIEKFVKDDKNKNTSSIVMEVAEFINSPINNDNTLELSNQEYIEKILNNPFAYEQAMYDMIRRISKLLSKYYPYDTYVYKAARDRMASLTKSGILDAETINSIHSDMLVYLLAQQEDSLFNGDTPIPINFVNTLSSNPSVRNYVGDITPDDNTIFVFGSNPEGRHGAGAAKKAIEQFGAIYGQGEGLQGNSYALPTKDLKVNENNSLRSVSKENIVLSIKKLYETARQNPNKQFKIAYRNTDEASLNGYTGLEMIDMFLEAGDIPDNIVFSKEWVDTGKFNTATKNSQDTTKTYVSAREYYTKHFAKILFDTLENNPEYKKLPIFQYMQFDINEKTEEISANILDIGGLASYLKDEIKESWASLMKESPDLARDLFMYNYYKLGFTFSPTAFMNLAPTRVKQSIKVGKRTNDGGSTWEDSTYIDFLNEVLKGDIMNVMDINNFIEQYVRNHTDNKKLVFSPCGSSLTFIKKEVIKNGVMQKSFTLDVSNLGEEANLWLLPSPNTKLRAFRPFIMVEGVLYMADNSNYGNLPDFNISNYSTIEYRKISKLGETNKSLQYLSNSNKEIKYENTPSSEKGSTSPDSTDLPPKIQEFNRDEIINEIADIVISLGVEQEFILEENAEKEKENYKQDLSSKSDLELKNKIEDLKKDIEKNDVIAQDDLGNLKPIC